MAEFVNVPYLTSPGSVETFLRKIAKASTPDRVTRDYVNSVLSIKGGTGQCHRIKIVAEVQAGCHLTSIGSFAPGMVV